MWCIVSARKQFHQYMYLHSIHRRHLHRFTFSDREWDESRLAVPWGCMLYLQRQTPTFGILLVRQDCK